MARQIEFFELLDRACEAVLDAEQRGETMQQLWLAPETYDAVHEAKAYELQREAPLSLLGLRVIRLDRPPKEPGAPPFIVR